MERRLEDRIRRLCHQAIITYDGENFIPILEELREALREHSERLRCVVVERLAAGLPIEERRRE